MQCKFGNVGSLNLWNFETKKPWIMTPFSSCSWPPYVFVASSIIAESCCGLHPLCCGQMAREIIDFVFETICVPDLWSCQSRAVCLIFVTFSMWIRGTDWIYFSLDKGVALEIGLVHITWSRLHRFLCIVLLVPHRFPALVVLLV